MKNFVKRFFYFFLITISTNTFANTTNNQTDDLSPVLSSNHLPFQIQIEQANFQLPVGLHSGVFAVYRGLWIFIAGRTDGMHAFPPIPGFPDAFQNRSIYVVNPQTGQVFSRSLNDTYSGLTQQQIDSLSSTSPEGYQSGDTLIIAGGYGFDVIKNIYTTQSTLTALSLPAVVQWVTNPNNKTLLVNAMQQISNPLFKISGGRMFKMGDTTQLIFGQDYEGPYNDTTSGNYSEQVRKFQIQNINGKLTVTVFPSTVPDPNFRRRDINIVPSLLNQNNLLKYGLVAYSGVFTLNNGVWTVPVVIDENGTPKMANPNLASTFKQGMNNYDCAAVGLYSRKYLSMYTIFFGGMSYEYYQNGVLEVDAEIPFNNQVTTVQMDKNGHFTQFLMQNEFPKIESTDSNPGQYLLFGGDAYFIPNNILQYPNHIINLDSIRKPTLIGYIVGGIQSTVPNTAVPSDSSASKYIFKVILTPQ